MSPLKYNYKGIHRIICVSERVKEAFKKMLKKRHHHKLTVIYDGIALNKPENPAKTNLRHTPDVEPHIFLIGNIANHAQSKDLGVLLKTAHYLVYELKRTNIRFVQMGKPSKFTKEFIGLSDTYNLRDYVTFMGFTANAHTLMNQFDVFIMTSKTEGIPLVIYEAFLNKVPVVSTVAGGIPEIITHHENGFLADIGDYKSLARYLDTLLKDRALREKFTSNSHKKLLAEYDAAKAAQHTHNLYYSMIHETS